MNEAISTKIEEIKSKFAEFKIALANEKLVNHENVLEKELLENKILDLKQKLIQSNNDLITSNEDLQNVKNELIDFKNSQQEKIADLNQETNHKSDLEIDFIVREIDACISQIKTSL